MKIISGNEYDLKQLMDGVSKRIEITQDKVFRYALIDYLFQLNGAYMAVSGKEGLVSEKSIFRSKSDRRNYIQYLNYLFTKLEEDFIKNKTVHQKHFDEMLEINENELEGLGDVEFSKDFKVMPEDEFCEYFYEFLEEYGLENLFDKFIDGRKIFNKPVDKQKMYNGTVIHDPLKKKSGIVLSEFEYTVPYLLTLAHEFGHTIDVGKLTKNDIDKYMNYSYSSVYGEVVSTLFEKLFYDFLLNKKYRVDEVKEEYSEFCFGNKHLALDTFLIASLSEQAIRTSNLGAIDEKLIIDELGYLFTNRDKFSNYLKDRKLSVWDSPLYAYGDYFSTILKDSIQCEGFDNEMVKKFMNIRTGLFDPDLLETRGFEMDDYKKIYKKDISRLKK